MHLILIIERKSAAAFCKACKCMSDIVWESFGARQSGSERHSYDDRAIDRAISA